MAETVRNRERRSRREALEKYRSRRCHRRRHHHGRSQANIAARVPGSAGALPRPRSQRKGARLVLAWGAATFGEGREVVVLRRGAGARAGAGWALELSLSGAVGRGRASFRRSCCCGVGLSTHISAAFQKLMAPDRPRIGPSAIS